MWQSTITKKVILLILISVCTNYHAVAQRIQLEIAGYGNTDYSSLIQNTTSETAGPAGNIVLEPALLLSDQLHFYSEFEIVHGIFNLQTLELNFNQGYFQYSLKDRLGIKAGIINSYYEDIYHNGVHHPMIDNQIMITGWQGLTLGIFGNLTNNINWELLVMQSMDQTMLTEYQNAALLTGATIAPEADGLGTIARMEYAITSQLTWIASYTYSEVSGYWGVDKSASLHLGESSMTFKNNGFKAKGAGAIQSVTGYKRNYEDVFNPKMRLGAYMEFGYDIKSLFRLPQSQSLLAFTRNEAYEEYHASFSDSPAKTIIAYTFGLNYYITDQFILKGAFQRNYQTDKTDRNLDRRINIGLMFTF